MHVMTRYISCKGGGGTRMTAAESQQHPWLQTSKENPLPASHKKNMRTYLENKKKWVRGWNCLVALSRMGANWDKLRAAEMPTETKEAAET
ncbi:unnamed protein product [Notodromas monacha]|uniref:Uncharacterized protein n=1 Tax=Notodromas monacha TaxID=399045 RepID=A0A7R9BGR0_9CRUS|nr:unnamed protein product [Notodromas monacha]CAG0914319.1 unnamed protein product [Notodromas monacha]